LVSEWVIAIGEWAILHIVITILGMDMVGILGTLLIIVTQIIITEIATGRGIITVTLMGTTMDIIIEMHIIMEMRGVRIIEVDLTGNVALLAQQHLEVLLLQEIQVPPLEHRLEAQPYITQEVLVHQDLRHRQTLVQTPLLEALQEQGLDQVHRADRVHRVGIR